MEHVELSLTTAQLAEKLGMEPAKVRRQLKNGKIRALCESQDLWCIEEIDLRAAIAKRNVSELVFEDYLKSQGYATPLHEPIMPGKSRRVDYRLDHKSGHFWFEIKEFEEDPDFLGLSFAAYDPYEGIRGKIAKASEKFKEYGDECCALVLYNDKLNFTDVKTSEFLLGAMLGGIQYRFPINIEQGRIDGPAIPSYGRGGAMRNPHTGKPINRRISALIGLQRFPVAKRKIRIDMERKKRELGRSFNDNEKQELLQIPASLYQQKVIRVLVCENPYATRPLPADLFTGPYDERWGLIREESVISRLFIGAELEALLEAEHELGLDVGSLHQKMQPNQEL